MRFPKTLSPNQALLRAICGHVILASGPMESFATWLLTGVAVILGAVLVNVEAVSSVVTAVGMRWGLALLVVSLLFGALAKQLAMAIRTGYELTERMYTELESEEGAVALEGLAGSMNEFKHELLSAFLFPLRGMMRRAFDRGAQDAIAGEKRLTRLFCVQLYAVWAQNIAAATGLLVLAFAIR